MVMCALFGFAAPIIIGRWIATLAAIANNAWVGPVVTLHEKLSLPTTGALAIVGLFTGSCARGVATWLTLADGAVAHRTSTAQAIRTTLRHFPPLVLGTLLYSFVSLILVACMVGMQEWAYGSAYEPVLLKSASGWPEPARISTDVSGQLIWRSASLLMPDLSPPLAQVASTLPAFFSGPTFRVTQYEQSLQTTHAKQEAVTLPNRVAVASALVFLVLEPLLRFRTVMAFKPSRSRQVLEITPGGKGSRRFAALSPLFASARFGLRHFGIVVVHVWATRLAIVAGCVVLIELPMVLATTFVLPNAARIAPNLPVLPCLALVQASAAAFVGALVQVFSAVYDAQLYVALSRSRTCDNPS